MAKLTQACIITWLLNGSQDLHEIATSKCLTFLGGETYAWSQKIMFVFCHTDKKGWTAQSQGHQGSIAINCSEPDFSPGIETLSHLNPYRFEFVQ